MKSDYNGWKNYETWNVALWIGNDEGLYHMAREYRSKVRPYKHFKAAMLEMNMLATPDGVAWDDSDLDLDALDEMIEKL